MKKYLTILITLSLMMAMASGCSSTPTDHSTAAPPDVAGTKYEEAVVNVVAKGFLDCAEDGNFGPENTVNRAELSVIMTKLLGATQAELDAALEYEFTDLAGYEWAEPSLSYMLERGMLSIYEDGNIHPENVVSFYEFIILLVKGLGYEPDDAGYNWYQGYLDKAAALGLLNSIPESVMNGNDNQIHRGDMAIIINNALNQLS